MFRASLQKSDPFERHIPVYRTYVSTPPGGKTCMNALYLSSMVEQHGYFFVGINVSYVIFVFYDMNKLFRLHTITFAYGADENKGPFIVRVICRAMPCVIAIKLHFIQLQLLQDCSGAFKLCYSLCQHTLPLLSHVASLH